MYYQAFPRAIEIQTVAACNAGCIICPHPEVSTMLPKGVMGKELFESIINQIDPAWTGRIIPYLNSEPLLDMSLDHRLRYVRSRLPSAEIELSTNVSLLNERRQSQLVGIPITELRLSVFGFTERTHRRLMPGLEWRRVRSNLESLVRNEALRRSIAHIGIVMIEHPDVSEMDRRESELFCRAHDLSFHWWGFLDRAQNVARFSNDIHRTSISGCEQSRPLERMHIMWTGQVVLCCQDWRWRHVLGDVRTQTLTEIWEGKIYQAYRRSIYQHDGLPPDICLRCKLSTQ